MNIRDKLRAQAWIGDAVLTLYARLRILREQGVADGPKAARMSSNQFLPSGATRPKSRPRSAAPTPSRGWPARSG